MFDTNFYRDKRVFITGHTGFVGAWMCQVLNLLGANVSGYALEPCGYPNLFSLCGIEKTMDSTIGDIRDFDKLKKTIDLLKPDIIIHLAAQPLVLEGYQSPLYTYETNVMGTINLLECIRQSNPQPQSVLNVTTDKVYLNQDKPVAFCESDPLDGFDPYSNSKSCSELISHCYKNSYFDKMGISISTARAGNIIGGGDFSKDRIVPDSIAAALSGKPVIVRNPHSIRPYQHVLESIFAYLLIAQKQYRHIESSGCYNVGPDEGDCQDNGTLMNLFCRHWGDGMSWEPNIDLNAPHEASYLKLSNMKIRNTFGWRPAWGIDTAIAKTVEWSKAYASGKNVSEITKSQINDFMEAL